VQHTNGKTEFLFDASTAQICVHYVFPHSGHVPAGIWSAPSNRGPMSHLAGYEIGNQKPAGVTRTSSGSNGSIVLGETARILTYRGR
jgi:hypothetical protein